jgi:hypothetical protein
MHIDSARTLIIASYSVPKGSTPIRSPSQLRVIAMVGERITSGISALTGKKDGTICLYSACWARAAGSFCPDPHRHRAQ